MDIGEKGIQRAVPKGFPYMLVEWETKAGERGALVHVIEDEKVFKRNFAQDVLAGMMDLPTSAMLRSGSQETASVVGSAMRDSRVVAALLEDLEKVRLDGRAGRVHKFLYAVLSRCFHHVQRADDVILRIENRHFDASGNAAPCRLIQHIIHTLAGLQEDTFVKEFTTHCNL